MVHTGSFIMGSFKMFWKYLVLFVVSTIASSAYGDHKHSESEMSQISFWDESKDLRELIKPPEFFFSFIASGRDLELPLLTADMNPKLTVFYRTPMSDLNNQSTEVIPHNPNPEWMNVFKFTYRKGEKEELQFKVKSVDSNRHEVPIGEAIMNMQELWQSLWEYGSVTLPLNNFRGVLVLKRAEVINFKLAASDLAKADTWGGKSDPFVKCLWSRGPDGPEVEFFQTSWIGNVVDAEWMEIISFEGYQEGTGQYLHFKVYDDDGITSDDFLGEAFLRIDDYQSESTKMKVVPLINEPKKKSGTGQLMIKFQ